MFVFIISKVMDLEAKLINMPSYMYKKNVKNVRGSIFFLISLLSFNFHEKLSSKMNKGKN